MINIKPFRGEIWVVDLDPVVGHEQAKKRPCLVVSNDGFNQGGAGLAVVIPLISRYKKLSWLVEVKAEGLDVISYALCHQMRIVSLDRFSKRSVGQVDDETLHQIETRLRDLLDL